LSASRQSPALTAWPSAWPAISSLSGEAASAEPKAAAARSKAPLEAAARAWT